MVAVLSTFITLYFTKDIKKTFMMVLFSVYAYLVVAITILSRQSNPLVRQVTLQPLGTIHNNYLSQKWLIENVILFIPYGGFIKLLFKRMGMGGLIFVSALSSLAIETIQLIMGRGNFEVDDIITNTFGAVVGFVLCCLAVAWQNYKSSNYEENMVLQASYKERKVEESDYWE